ncbi:unnamed protein product [Moneuplotes crassus]|uniref:Uncharacterized protein n=1 Tax=Euplotes crassus TaxID=5936 RepID=A0AAD1UFA3_EUPCR|nr:unnamed protein product [Moneuplotes crassus]
MKHNGSPVLGTHQSKKLPNLRRRVFLDDSKSISYKSFSSTRRLGTKRKGMEIREKKIRAKVSEGVFCKIKILRVWSNNKVKIM